MHPYLLFRDSSLNRFQKLTNDIHVQLGVRGSGQSWFMNNECLKHLTGKIKLIFSDNVLQCGGVFFWKLKKGVSLVLERLVNLSIIQSRMYNIKSMYVVDFKLVLVMILPTSVLKVTMWICCIKDWSYQLYTSK